MAGKVKLVGPRVREENPTFAKLLDVLNNSILQDGKRKETASRLKQVESRLKSTKEHYHEQLLFSSELAEVLHSRTDIAPLDLLAAGEIQHCLELSPATTLLGLEVDHLRAVNPLRGVQKSKEAVYADLDQHLKTKCLRVVQWHTSQKERGGSDALQLARVEQLPQLLTQQKEEERQKDEELEQLRQDFDRKLITKHRILTEVCAALKEATERYKVAMTTEANHTSLTYRHSQCQAMLGKLEVMHHQLLKGICSDGRVQALKEIRSHLLSARKKLEERLLQTRQILGHYHNMGEEFVQLVQEYQEILSELENKKWALNELSKTETRS